MTSILVVTSLFPSPEDHGDALRTMSILRGLPDVNKVTVITMARPTTTVEDVDALREAVNPASLVVVPPNANAQGPLQKLARAIRAILTLTPPLFFTAWSKELHDAVSAVTADIALLIGEPAGLCVAACAPADVVWDKANVFTAFSIASLSRDNGAMTRLKYFLYVPLSYVYEKRVIREVAQVWVTSPEEATRLKRLFSREADAVIPSAVRGAEAGRTYDPVAARRLLWLGTFGYKPNWEGLLRLITNSRDFRRRNGVTLVVVGGGATAAQVRLLQREQFVDYLGFVEDLSSVAGTVRAGIVPIWTGAGVKLKTITMMSLGVPVVSTFAGMEGIPSEAALAISNDVEALMDAFVSASDDELQRVVASAHVTLAGQFSEVAFARELRSALARVILAPEKRHD